MIEETAVRVEISAARFASQSIFDILRLTVQAMNSQNYGQQLYFILFLKLIVFNTFIR